MNKFYIKDLEQITGIKAATLRIWEQRYGVLTPKRTETNIRYYDEKDLRLLLNIAILLKNGYRISELAYLPENELIHKVKSVTAMEGSFEAIWQSLTMAMLALNEHTFEKILNQFILQHGIEKTMLQVLMPFFKNLGVMWQTGSINPAHEHFITNIIRQKLLVAIDGQSKQLDSFSKKYLLFLPENEFHEIGLLFANYILRSRGHQVIYLGQNVPYDDLEVISKIYEPDFLFCVITTPLADIGVAAYLNKLSADFCNTQILVSGHAALQQADQVNGKNIKFLHTFEEMIASCSELN